MERIKENKGIALMTMIIIIVVVAIIIVGIGSFLFINSNKKNSNKNIISTNNYETEIYEDNNVEENESINQEDSREDEDTENDTGEISWNALFPDGGNRITITFREDREVRAFKMDFPEKYELNPWQCKYEGQTVKDLIKETGDIQKNVDAQGEDADLWVYIETTEAYENETYTQRAERKNPEGFALGTEEHPAWAYKDSGEIHLSYQGGPNYALVVSYDNFDAVNKYGAQAVAEFLYNMISYSEN